MKNKKHSNLDPRSILIERGIKKASGNVRRSKNQSSHQRGGIEFNTPQGSRSNLDVFNGSSIFLISSGPSLNDLNLEEINRVGAMSLGVNNSWHVFKPRFWTCADTPDRFLFSRWVDPGITKLVPSSLKGLKLREQVGNELVESEKRTCDCPNVFYYRRNLDFNPSSFLTERTVNWGGHTKVKDSMGIAGARSVLFSALKLCYSLGFRTVYLCGVDFEMNHGAQNYAFEQERTKSAVKGNNNSYKANIKRLKSLRPVFDQAGFQVFNCNPRSRLDAFSFISFDEAIHKCEENLIPLESSKGWYDKVDKKIKVKRK
tara:strand:- start:242 stop:1186 length:945 start_codon:yes stop_codon:yes gene_type:complete